MPLRMRWMLCFLPLLMLAACGAAIISEDFEATTELPPSLRPENLISGIGEDSGLLSLIVAQPGRGQRGRLFLGSENIPSAVSFSARLRIISGRASLWIRSDEAACAGYALTIDPIRDAYRLSTVDENCDISNFETESRLNVDLNQWFDMRIEAQADTIRGFVDRAKFFEVTDANYTDGLAFIEVITGSDNRGQIEVDSLTLRE